MFEESKINQFKQQAKEKGYSDHAINKFIKSKESQPEPITYQPQVTGIEDFSQNISRYPTISEKQEFSTKSSMLPASFAVTQPFGNRSSVESFSKGINLGTDFAAPKGTPMSVPAKGSWVVEKVYSGAREGDRSANSGSGNMVKLVNMQTGEKIAFEHLNRVNVKPGQKVPPGLIVGTSGNTGNSTGPHASIPYQDASGNYKDIRSTPYF